MAVNLTVQFIPEKIVIIIDEVYRGCVFTESSDGHIVNTRKHGVPSARNANVIFARNVQIKQIMAKAYFTQKIKHIWAVTILE